MDNKLIYIYCLTEALPILKHDLKVEELDLMQIGGFYVIVKRVSAEEFSENNLRKKLDDLDWVERNARHHMTVITHIMEEHSVIPFQFGTLFKTENSLNQFIEKHSSSLSHNLLKIDKKEEWAVKIYCDKKQLSKKISEFSKNVRSIEKQILESSPGRAFLLKRKKVELTKQEVNKLISLNGQQCFNAFKNICTDEYANNILPREITKRNDDMILNVSFLICKNDVSDFVTMVSQHQHKYKSVHFSFEVTGPWPPFHFITIDKHG
ncbi:GvpL/GvpF family gas vesicle protein [Prolixibacteraceae bacterium JC049]|nr:GvpL/GvpF family gas vesicle protein [Prolixibacteraceae bacterium JC049]